MTPISVALEVAVAIVAVLAALRGAPLSLRHCLPLRSMFS